MRLNTRELEQLDAAIHAHSRWITQLRIAIEDGTSEFDPELIRADNKCDFGKWLYDDFPKEAENRAIFDEIRARHAAFHRTAAQILRFALSGRREEALKLMDLGGDFMHISSALILNLRALRQPNPG
jgi:hypothetical protein